MTRGNLLIIDDEESLASNLADILESNADNIYVANEAKKGLSIIEQEKIDCVICDISMPGLSGIEFAKIIRKSGNMVPFIFFTAYALDDYKSEASKIERAQFIVKPDFTELVNDLDKMLKLGFEERVGKMK
jgi:DNA-binding NtrC family response regulator